MTTETQEHIETPEESDAALASGFAMTRGSEPPKQEEPPKPEPVEKAEEAKADEQTAATAEQDPWKDVHPRVKAEFDSIRQSLDGASKDRERLRNIEGTLGGLSQLTKELKTAVANAATVARESGKETPSKAEVDAAVQSPEGLKQLMEDYPDIGKAVAGVAGQVGALRSEIEAAKKAAPQVDVEAIKAALTSDFEKRLEQAVQAAGERAEVHAFLDRHHEGWKETVNSPEYEAWFKAQNAETQALGASDNRQDAKKLLDLYAAATKRAAEQAERQKRLERSIAPKGTVVTQVVEDEEAALERGFKLARGR